MALKRTPTAAPGNLAPHRAAAAPAVYNGGQMIPGFGDVNARDDIIIPRLKLLQGLSPEVKENPKEFIQGEWFHNVLGECMGKALTVIPLQVVPSIELWAPRQSGEGLLARSADRIHWDKPHTKFPVRIGGRAYVWDTKGSVAESGLAEFGTSDPTNPKSPPAAPLTYRLALWLVDEPEISPVLMIASRMGAQGVKDLIARVRMRYLRGAPFFGQKFNLLATEMIRGPNQFYVPKFNNAGDVTDLDLLDQLQAEASMMASMNVRASDERSEADDVGTAQPDRGAHRGRGF